MGLLNLRCGADGVLCGCFAVSLSRAWARSSRLALSTVLKRSSIWAGVNEACGGLSDAERPPQGTG